MITDHTYYLASRRQVLGPAAKDLDTVIFLVATYLRLLPVDQAPGRYDGVSLFQKDGKQTGFSVVLGEVKTLERLP